MITKAFFVLVQPQTADRDLCKCIRLWPLPYHSCRPVRARFGIGQVDISGLISDIITLLWCLTCTVPRMYITGRPRCKDELFGTVLVRQPRKTQGRSWFIHHSKGWLTSLLLQKAKHVIC